MTHVKSIVASPVLWGIGGALGIGMLFYLVQVVGMQDWLGPLYFVQTKWYFVIPLIAGFGIQMGLFRAIHLKAKFGSGMLATSGGVSTGAMAACCAHNFVPLLPIVGFSGMATFFSVYQDYVFAISLLFVLGGVMYMAKKYKEVKRHSTI